MVAKSRLRANLPPRILYLCSSWPLGKVFGGQLRALHIGRALKEVGEVTVAVVSSEAHDAGAMGRTREEFAVEEPICPELQPNRTVLEKMRRLFDRRYLNVHGCTVSVEQQERLSALVPDYDLIWVLNSRTPNLLKRWHWPNAHLDVDDIPSTYLRGVAQNGTSVQTRWKARVQHFLLKRRELLFRERFATLSVCSEGDRRYLGGGERIHVIPNGFERPEVPPAPTPCSNPPRLGFIGLCSYEPNREGVRWFLEKCWPAIRREIPGIRFRLAGNGAEALVDSEDRDVDVLGWIDDAAVEVATWSAMVIPIRFGGGTRVKIADAFSRKCPVVSTGLGAFGYDVQDGRELLLADDARTFSDACLSLIRNQQMGREMAERAHAAFLEKWTWDAIAPKVWAAAEDCLRQSRRG